MPRSNGGGTVVCMTSPADLQGWTMQSGYGGPLMHPSEFVGGRLEDHIRENPGLYVALVIDTEDEEPASWAIAYREG